MTNKITILFFLYLIETAKKPQKVIAIFNMGIFVPIRFPFDT